MTEDKIARNMDEKQQWEAFIKHPCYVMWQQYAMEHVDQLGESSMTVPEEVMDLVKLQRIVGQIHGVRNIMAYPTLQIQLLGEEIPNE